MDILDLGLHLNKFICFRKWFAFLHFSEYEVFETEGPLSPYLFCFGDGDPQFSPERIEGRRLHFRLPGRRWGGKGGFPPPI